MSLLQKIEAAAQEFETDIETLFGEFLAWARVKKAAETTSKKGSTVPSASAAASAALSSEDKAAALAGRTHDILRHCLAIEGKLDMLTRVLIITKGKIMANLDQLTADVTADTNAVNAATTLLTNLTAEIKAAGTDPVALKALTDTLEANTASLAAAVAANTPAAPTDGQ